jgi:hypothetical protein
MKRRRLACADGNEYLSGLAWTSWGPRLASATGTEHVNDCVPLLRGRALPQLPGERGAVG